MDYSEQIKKDGDKYGYKTANLMNLQNVLRDFKPEDGGIKVDVPSFQGLSDEQIQGVLDKLVPGWKGQWNSFLDQFKADGDGNTFSNDALKILEKLQQDIETAFSKQDIFSNNLQLDNSLDAKMFMVRSTGREDSVDVANPGGNASYPSKNDSASVSKAIGGVIASYFDKKSLSQRLAAGLDITEKPFMPVLVQNLIGEGVSSSKAMITSGVIYSGHGQTKIDAAPGHGELVVNSKGPVDSFYVTSSSVIYPEVSAKPFRMRPVFDEKSGKLSLEMVSNSVTNEYDFSLDESVVRTIHQLAQHIEQAYGMPMDTEFAYDHGSKTIHVVQTRPIPEGKNKGIMPSALDPELTDKAEAKYSGHTITSNLKTAKIIDDASKILVCDPIEEALNYYLHNKNGKQLGAVIVKKTAPSTSHEAGEFSSVGIPVIQLDDKDKVADMLKDVASKNLVIDPQRKTVFQMPEGKKPLLKEGLFKSTLSGNVSLFNQQFKGDPEKISKVKLSSDGIKFSEMLLAAKLSNPEKLFSYIYSNIEKAGTFKAFAPSEKEPESMLSALDKLQNLTADNIDQNREDLTKIMSTITQLKKQNLGISSDLFKQLMISGAEALSIIDEIKKTKAKNPSEHASYSEYLDVYEKFSGMISGQSNGMSLSNNLRKDLAQAKLEKEVSKMLEGKNVSPEQKQILTESLKLSEYLISDQSKEDWKKFCLELCSDKDQNLAKDLANLAGNIAHMGLQDKWINISFAVRKLENQEESSQDLLKTLNLELGELEKQKDQMQEINAKILAIKSATESWKEPGQFEKLQKQLHADVIYIKDNLSIDKKEPALLQVSKAKQMNDLVDAMDLTLKSLGTSGLYENQTQQADNFQYILEDFHRLLKTWSKDVGDYRAKNAIFAHVNDMLGREATKADLSLSGFSPAATKIDTKIVGDRDGWSRILPSCKTLQDCFTLIHQNLITTISLQTKEVNAAVEKLLPEEFLSIKEKVVAYNFSSNEGIYECELIQTEFDYPKIKMHYNLPLRNHSALVELEYDTITQKTTLGVKTFGINRNQRWNIAEDFINAGSAILGLDLSEKGKFDENSSVVTFTIDLTKATDSTLQNAWKVINEGVVKVSFLERLEFSIYDLLIKEATSKMDELITDNPTHAMEYISRIKNSIPQNKENIGKLQQYIIELEYYYFDKFVAQGDREKIVGFLADNPVIIVNESLTQWIKNTLNSTIDPRDIKFEEILEYKYDKSDKSTSFEIFALDELNKRINNEEKLDYRIQYCFGSAQYCHLLQLKYLNKLVKNGADIEETLLSKTLENVEQRISFVNKDKLGIDYLKSLDLDTLLDKKEYKFLVRDFLYNVLPLEALKSITNYVKIPSELTMDIDQNRIASITNENVRLLLEKEIFSPAKIDELYNELGDSNFKRIICKKASVLLLECTKESERKELLQMLVNISANDNNKIYQILDRTNLIEYLINNGEGLSSKEVLEKVSKLYDDIGENKLNFISSTYAVEIYKSSGTIEQLEKFYDKYPNGTMSMIIDIARACNEGVNFQQLSEMSKQKIRPLISNDAIKKYQAGITFDQLSKLYDHVGDPKNFSAIIKQDISEVKKAIEEAEKALHKKTPQEKAKEIGKGINENTKVNENKKLPELKKNNGLSLY